MSETNTKQKIPPMNNEKSRTGEMMMKEVKVSVHYIKKGEKLKVEHITISRGDSFVDIPTDVTLDANIWMPERKYTPKADLPTKGSAAVGTVKHSFLYLDCGRWGGDFLKGGQRTFGVVWGRWAALCEFKDVSNAPFINPPQINDPNPKKNEINGFFEELAMRGIEVKLLRSAHSETQLSFYNSKLPLREPITVKEDRVYVIIPDLHLPIISKDLSVASLKKDQGDGLEGLGRISGNAFKLVTKNNKLQLKSQFFTNLKKPGYTDLGTNKFGAINDKDLNKEFSVVNWHTKYREGDIFQKNRKDAENDLISFLKAIRGITRRGTKSQNETIGMSNNSMLHLMQIGDMYELWIGLGRFFKRANNSVVLEKCKVDFNGVPDNNIQPEEFITKWVAKTDANFPNLIKAFKEATRESAQTFLYGNHDNYLAAFTPPNMIKREKERRKGGHYFEHGHRGDSFNRDGATEGHVITQAVHHMPSIRRLDPNRRPEFIATAALSFLQKPDFVIYGMGHTHNPYLTKVIIEFVELPTRPPSLPAGL